MNLNRISFQSAILLLTMLSLTVPAMADDRIARMCILEEQAMPDFNGDCGCALERVAKETSEDDFDIYVEVGTAYFANMADGQARSEAWEAAARSVGKSRSMSLISVLNITNPIGRTHQQALKACQ